MRVTRKVAAKIAEVRPRTINQWVHRGVINRYDEGYEVAEILLWLRQERSQFAMDLRAGLSPGQSKTA
jgi:hypothetical protein